MVSILKYLLVFLAIVSFSTQNAGISKEQLYERVDYYLNNEILPKIEEFVNIPNLSQAYDPDFHTNGLMMKANRMYFEWFKTMGLKGVSKSLIYEEEGKTPLTFITVEASDPSMTSNVLLYGHNDKQPHMMNDWSEGLHPFKFVRRGDKAYGRGVSDDGYAFPTAVTMIKLLQENNIPHGRFIIFVESDEESGSADIMYHMDMFKDDIGEVDLIVCLDSGAADYEHFYQTVTLRGFALVKVNIKTLANSMHSGVGGGVVPDVFRIFRMLLSRIEDEKTGDLPGELFGDIPCELYSGACRLIELIGGKKWLESFSMRPGFQFEKRSALEGYLANNYKPSLTVIGLDGIPSTERGGNVLRSEMSASLSIRLPPWVTEETAKSVLEKLLTTDVPYGAHVTVDFPAVKQGFYSPPLPKEQREALEESAKEAFGGNDMMLYSCGGSIPFMGDLNKKFPNAKFLVTGVLGPDNNAHAGNEMLYIPMLRKVLFTITRFMEKSGSIEWEKADSELGSKFLRADL